MIINKIIINQINKTFLDNLILESIRINNIILINNKIITKINNRIIIKIYNKINNSLKIIFLHKIIKMNKINKKIYFQVKMSKIKIYLTIKILQM